ncbi:hypothetical protein LEP1GSC034_4825 [Leptospira interrogans str. 2003000735]|uniref:Uncharacterized protein n=2 Tax=Leptospira interrogans TaxID=173 RepID=A0A829D203_LEPIR|nr:hypothetical protein LEP1GSC027_2113 [Leptospira interrogans str. 2002000624]EKQ39862.1 hypothetical protein LEP1GSC025_4845 [Leptospira interrogans str. 2002000621]EKQ49772.1 hypothetical protein LEP1GSC026_1197 [Leptospira interrogans str. 2002000623]EMJ67300.1 hypothetical protein LEP1GSC034_4825 [Leptospira interrogans str. 2003000735]EMJ67825.1 hypothetical protein LEP1GSC033_2111 [Leptospira interrogans str. 2002000632]EMY05734.1 hypothetical protein LEP1GSC029_1290 [Leptospira interr
MIYSFTYLIYIFMFCFFNIRIVEKLILHLFLFYGNRQLKQFY